MSSAYSGDRHVATLAPRLVVVSTSVYYSVVELRVKRLQTIFPPRFPLENLKGDRARQVSCKYEPRKWSNQGDPCSLQQIDDAPGILHHSLKDASRILVFSRSWHICAPTEVCFSCFEIHFDGHGCCTGSINDDLSQVGRKHPQLSYFHCLWTSAYEH